MSRDHRYFVYLLASKPSGTLYIGVTSDLVGRTAAHRDEIRAGFTKRYGIHRLVWFEEYGDVQDAIVREKRMKKWLRAWKVELIEKANPRWDDLFPDII